MNMINSRIAGQKFWLLGPMSPMLFDSIGSQKNYPSSACPIRITATAQRYKQEVNIFKLGAHAASEYY